MFSCGLPSTKIRSAFAPLLISPSFPAWYGFSDHSQQFGIGGGSHLEDLKEAVPARHPGEMLSLFTGQAHIKEAGGAQAGFSSKKWTRITFFFSNRDGSFNCPLPKTSQSPVLPLRNHRSTRTTQTHP